MRKYVIPRASNSLILVHSRITHCGSFFPCYSISYPRHFSSPAISPISIFYPLKNRLSTNVNSSLFTIDFSYFFLFFHQHSIPSILFFLTYIYLLPLPSKINHPSLHYHLYSPPSTVIIDAPSPFFPPLHSRFSVF